MMPDTTTETDVKVQAGFWHAVLAVEGVRTSDGREFAPNSLRWRALPLPLMMQLQTAEGHKGSVVVGRIDRIERIGNEIHGWGPFDLGSDNGKEASRLVSEQIMRGISVDAELMEIDKEMLMGDEDGVVTLLVEEGRIGAATIVHFPAFPEAVIALADTEIPISTPDGRGEATPFTPTEADLALNELFPHHDDDGAVSKDLLRVAAMTFNLTSAPTATLAHARSHLSNHYRDDFNEAPPKSLTQLALTAHAAQQGPPAEWFADPELKGVTPLTIARSGRIYGHAADWNSCHTGYRECMRPPRSRTNYAHFLTGAVFPSDCDCDDALATGPITLGTTHADPYSAADPARRHYDNTGMAVADVVVGEDAFGIWVAGALRPGVTDSQIRALRGSSLSGDWRYIGGNMELISLLAVNTPGFPIPRVTAATEAGIQVSLVAAGIPEDNAKDDAPTGADPADILSELKKDLLEKEDDTAEDVVPEDPAVEDNGVDDSGGGDTESTDESTDDSAADEGGIDSPTPPPSSGLAASELISQLKAPSTTA